MNRERLRAWVWRGARVGVGLACVVGVASHGDAQPATAADLEAQLARQMQAASEQLESLTANLPRLADIEREQEALLQKLGQRHDALKAEKARTARLSKQLRRLTAGTSGLNTPSASASISVSVLEPSASSERWLALPERRIDALGMVESAWQRMGSVPAGTEHAVPRWPAGLVLPEGKAWPVVRSAEGRTRLVAEGAAGDERTLAELELRGREVWWRWSSGASGPGLGWFDAALRRTPFEARRAGVALATYQVEPARVSVALRGLPRDGSTWDAMPVLGLGTNPDVELGPVVMRARANPPGWALLATEPRHLAWLHDERSVQATLSDHGRLRLAQGPGLRDRLETLNRQRRAWQADTSSPDAWTRAMAQEELVRLDAEVSAMEALRASVAATAMSESASGVAPLAESFAGQPVAGQPGFELVAPESGVVLVIVTLSTGGI